MTKRRACPPAPGPLEDYAARFDALFGRLAQRRSFRAYLQGLLLPRDRNKTLTALAGAEPILGAQHAAVQELQWFLTESTWDHEQVNQRRLQLLLGDPATRPHDHGVLVIDDTGDRKAGTATAHVARQYLGSLGKTDNGLVAVTSLWAGERVYWPAHTSPYTPASRLPGGKRDPEFRTKPQLAVGLVQTARQAGIGFRAVVADCFYGDNEGFTQALGAAGVAYVLAVKARKGVWASADQAHSPQEAAHELAWTSPADPGDWTPFTRRFRNGHTETWWAAEAALPAAGWGPDQPVRLVVATTDPATLPKLTTWYLVSNLPRPGQRACGPFPPAGLAELVRLYGLRNWVEQGYKQVKHELGWADFQVRSDRAIRRHWQLVCCAFSFCWWAWFTKQPGHQAAPSDPHATPAAARGRRPDSGQRTLTRVVSWPVTLRRVRGWLTPWVVLRRWWRAWSTAPPPVQLGLLLDTAHAGQPLYLYIPP
ncbi:MAG TPA: IS701 family transposase [Actinomycetota bacterium]|nr:IS701 family transposase [Actinomycetota bacterium]